MTEKDWEKAEKHLTACEEVIKELSSTPGYNYLAKFVAGLKVRFDEGERTHSLYKEIMDLSGGN